jgi:hypothetical protein
VKEELLEREREKEKLLERVKELLEREREKDFRKKERDKATNSAKR